MTIYSVIGFITLALGWLIIVYAIFRNQRAAAASPIVDTTNIGARIAAIVEVILHPNHAATWRHTDGRRVFPALGQDSSEAYGIREDDGKTT